MKNLLLGLLTLLCVGVGYSREMPENITIKGEKYELLTDLSRLLAGDKVVFVSEVLAVVENSPNKVGDLVAMSTETLAYYRKTSYSHNDGISWDNEDKIDILTAETSNGKYAFKSNLGYLSTKEDKDDKEICEFEQSISETSIFDISIDNNYAVISNTVGGKETKLNYITTDRASVDESYFAFKIYDSYNDYLKPYYIYHTVKECSAPMFSAKDGRHPKALDLTISAVNDNEQLSYEVYKAGDANVFMSGNSTSGKVTITLPKDDALEEVTYTVDVTVTAEGYLDKKVSAEYIISNRKYLAFVRATDPSVIHDDDLLVFVCPEINKALFFSETGQDNSDVELYKDRIDIDIEAASKISFFKTKPSESVSDAYMFYDHSLAEIGAVGYLCSKIKGIREGLIEAEEDNVDYNYDWRLNSDNGRVTIAPVNTEADITTSQIMCARINPNTNKYEFLRASEDEIGDENYGETYLVVLYHQDTAISSVEIVEQEPDAEIVSVNGGVKINCQLPVRVNIYTLTGQIVSSSICSDGQTVALPTGFYIATTPKTATKVIVR